MRNLKKVLALVMAAAMSLTMVAGAKFTDESEIKSLEAVNTLAAIGIIKGYTDGAYQPEKIVSRGEMAKMIYTLRNGGNDDASMYANLPTKFTDVNGHWAASYIKYAQSLGIIAGKSATKFMPDAPVTGMEAAKMLLVVAGFAADKAELTGPNWALNTSVLAAENGLFNGYATDVAGPAPRQYAAQIIYNAFDMDTVKYSKDSDSFVSESTDRKNSDIKTKYLKMQTAIGIYEGNDKFGGLPNKGEITVNLTSDTGSNASPFATGNRQAKFAADLSLVGEEVKVIYKESSNSTAGLDNQDFVFGMTATGGTNVHNIFRYNLQEPDTNKLKFGDKNYTTGITNALGSVVLNQIDVVLNYNTSTPAMSVATFDSTYRHDSADTIKFVVDKNGNLTKAYVVTKEYSKVASVTATQFQIDGNATVKFEDAIVYEGMAKDDFVTYSKLYTGNELVVEKAEVIEGKIQAVKSTAEVQVNDTWYKMGALPNMKANGYTKPNSFNVGDTYKFILDGKHWVGAKAVTTTSKDYALVLGSVVQSSGFDYGKVKLLLADGTEKVLNAHKDNAVIGSNFTAGDLVSYEIVNTGTEVKMTKTTDSAVNGSYKKDNKALTVGGSPYLTDTNAVIYVQKSGTTDYKAYSANDLGDFSATLGSTVKYKLDSGKILAAFMVVGGFPSGGTDSSKYGYVVGDQVKTKDSADNDISKYDVWDGNATVTIIVDGVTGSSVIPKGSFIKYGVSDKAIDPANITAVAASQTEVAFGNILHQTIKIKEYDTDRRIVTSTNGVVKSNGEFVNDTINELFKIDNDTVIIGVKTKDQKGDIAQSINQYTKLHLNDFDNATVIYDDSTGVNIVKAIYVDVDGKIAAWGIATGVELTVEYTATVVSPPVATDVDVNVASVNKVTVINPEAVTVTLNVAGLAANSSAVVTISNGTSTFTTTVTGNGSATVTNIPTANATYVVTAVAGPIVAKPGTPVAAPTVLPTTGGTVAASNTATVVAPYQGIVATSKIWTGAADSTNWASGDKPVLTVTYTAPTGYVFTAPVAANFVTLTGYDVPAVSATATTITVVYTHTAGL